MKRKARYVRWLYGELPELVRRGVISEEAARRLREHYGDVGNKRLRATRVAAVVCSVLGGLLIGGGILLIVGHNWEDLPRSVRTALAFTPLLTAQALGFWVLARRNCSTPWREGVATFLALSVGAALALVYQIYHIPEAAGGILLKWGLLLLPVIYVFRSTSVVLLYLYLIVSWTMRCAQTGETAAFWLLLSAALPKIFFEFHRRGDSAAAVLQAWGLALCLTAGLPCALHSIFELNWGVLAYSALFGGMYLAAGVFSSEDRPKRCARPFAVVGALGTLLLYLLTIAGLGGGAIRFDRIGWASWDFAVLWLLFAVALLLLARTIQLKKYWGMLLGIGPVVMGAGCFSPLAFDRYAGLFVTLLSNAYVLAIGALWVVHGARRGEIARVNGGMAIVSVLAFMRFFDSRFSFVARGIAFIAVGIAFLALNLMLFRRGRSDAARPANSETGDASSTLPEDPSR